MDISLKFIWKEVQADYSNCFLCGELIKDQMYQACTILMGEEILMKQKMCDKCKTLMDQKDG